MCGTVLKMKASWTGPAEGLAGLRFYLLLFVCFVCKEREIREKVLSCKVVYGNLRLWSWLRGYRLEAKLKGYSRAQIPRTNEDSQMGMVAACNPSTRGAETGDPLM